MGSQFWWFQSMVSAPCCFGPGLHTMAGMQSTAKTKEGNEAGAPQFHFREYLKWFKNFQLGSSVPLSPLSMTFQIKCVNMSLSGPVGIHTVTHCPQPSVILSPLLCLSKVLQEHTRFYFHMTSCLVFIRLTLEDFRAFKVRKKFHTQIVLRTLGPDIAYFVEESLNK